MSKVHKSSAEKGAVCLHGYRPNARSCLACHRRKVRCDRGVPCTNCSKCGFACVYPTKDKDEHRSSNLQQISERLGRLEALLSRLVEPRVSAASGEVENRVQQESNFPSTQGDSKTWEVLLNDGDVVQYVNNSNIKDLLQNVSLESHPVQSSHSSKHYLGRTHEDPMCLKFRVKKTTAGKLD